MTYMIRIVADMNDADYTEQVSKISDKDLVSVKKVVEAIKNFKPYPWSESFGDHTPMHESNFPTNHSREDLGEMSAYDYYVGQGLITEDEFEIFLEYAPSSGYEGIHTVTEVEIWEEVPITKLL